MNTLYTYEVKSKTNPREIHASAEHVKEFCPLEKTWTRIARITRLTLRTRGALSGNVSQGYSVR